MCFGCSKEPFHRGGSFEYPQHMVWLRNKKNKFLLHTLILGPEVLLHITSISMYMHAQLSSGAKGLKFGQHLNLLPYFVCERSEDFGNTEHFHRLD